MNGFGRMATRVGILFGALSFSYGCSDEGSSSQPSVTISAPVIVSPEAGTQVLVERPTLVVQNVTVSDGAVPTYTFQVASDSGFASIVAQGDVAQGPSGETSFTVTTPLSTGTFFWRARASASGTSGPFSASSELNVLVAFLSTSPRDQLLVFDPLTSGFSVGNVVGGEFTDRGWKVLSSINAIVYELPTIEEGFVEMDITGLSPRNPSDDVARMIFIMWDPTLGPDSFTANNFRVSFTKRDRRAKTDRYFRIRFIANGEEHNRWNSFIDWSPEQIFTLRLQWGREGDGSVKMVRVFLNDDEQFAFPYQNRYNPAIHRIELGSAPRQESLKGAIYSNVRIGIR